MNYWVYTIFGTGKSAPPVEWLSAWEWHRKEMWFPRSKRPVGISEGDRAVVYGSAEKGFIAAVEIVGHEPEERPEDAPEQDRFAFLMRHRLLVAKAADANVASAEAAGIPETKIRRGPHTKIGKDMYERAVAAMLEAAAQTAGV